MGQPWSQQPHTLAQFARRAGMAESGARARYREGKLPAPDRTDADGKPLWFPATIDAWCARTGKEVAEKALWLFRAPAAVTPAVEVQRAVVELRSGYHRFTALVIVWDTDQGHVVYLQPVGETGGAHKDWLAAGAAELLRPAFWSTAVVVMPIEENLEHTLDYTPQAYIYRLTTTADPDEPTEPGGDGDRDSSAAVGSPFAGMRRWFRRTPADPAVTASPAAAGVTARAVWEGQLELEDISRAIGQPLPLWLYDTTTVENARKAARFDRTFPVPDTVTDWPAALARLELAAQTGMIAEFPAAFAALATDTNEGLAALRAAHDSTADHGPGWYLACRPTRPAVPVQLEQHLLAGTVLHPGVVTDLDQIADELVRLRALEADLDVDDPRGDAYAHVIGLLAWQLRRAARDAGEISDLDEDYVRVADDELVRYSAPWDGPVVDAWRRTLTPITDLGQDREQVRRLRRVHRLLRDDGLDADRIREVYRDAAGRYVLVVELNHGELWSYAEWPVALTAVETWTEQTVLAADDTRGSTVTLLALTPTENGGLRTDPVPMPPRSHRDGFAYGYGGGTPGTTYQALLRAALGDGPGTFSHLTDPDDSDLWHAIVTTKNSPLRLPWPKVKAWAHTDHNRARGIPTTWPPTKQ